MDLRMRLGVGIGKGLGKGLGVGATGARLANLYAVVTACFI